MPLGGAVRVSHAPLATTPANAPRADRAADRKQEARKQAAAAARGARAFTPLAHAHTHSEASPAR